MASKCSLQIATGVAKIMLIIILSWSDTHGRKTAEKNRKALGQ
jgi:hypothetical protein